MNIFTYLFSRIHVSFFFFLWELKTTSVLDTLKNCYWQGIFKLPAKNSEVRLSFHVLRKCNKHQNRRNVSFEKLLHLYQIKKVTKLLTNQRENLRVKSHNSQYKSMYLYIKCFTKCFTREGVSGDYLGIL